MIKQKPTICLFTGVKRISRNNAVLLGNWAEIEQIALTITHVLCVEEFCGSCLAGTLTASLSSLSMSRSVEVAA
jgi:hypothetical protein